MTTATSELLHQEKKHIDKHMGCMSGFLHIFDRHHILAGKRIYAAKRLPSSPSADSASQSEKSEGSSPLCSKEEGKQKTQQQNKEEILVSVPECVKSSPTPEILTLRASEVTAKLPVYEFKEVTRSSWKFRETPRLSLDSRASVDGKGSLYPREIRTNAAILSANRLDSADEDEEKKLRSPSVIARLMGLEELPESRREGLKKSELRRSASESRSRDLVQYRFGDGNVSNFQQKQGNAKSEIAAAGAEDRRLEARVANLEKLMDGGFPAKSPQQQQRRSFFDAEDFFPEPKQTGSLYGEIEKRLKMRGIDEPAKDLEALKQVLEALQLKGLLRSQKPMDRRRVRNFVSDRKLSFQERPRSVVSSMNQRRRIGNNSPDLSCRSKPGIERNVNLNAETLPPAVKPRVDRSEVAVTRNSPRRIRSPSPMSIRSPDRSECNVKSPSSLAKRRSLSIETQRRRNANDSVEQRRSSSPSRSPIHSPKLHTRKTTESSRSPRRSTAEIASKQRISRVTEDESSSISESSFISSASSSQERSKTENYKEGKNLLARCDRLLNSIAEITAANDSQPSPISVLDSSFYQDELSLSPVMKRCIKFKDESVKLIDGHDEKWSQEISQFILKPDDNDFLYVTQILQASNGLYGESDLFVILEKQHYKSNSSGASRQHRKLVFDIIIEILDKKKQLPPWKALPSINFATSKPAFKQIWLEFLRIRERKCVLGDMFEVVCGVLEKDMTGKSSNGWDDHTMVMSDMVLDIERLIFKDLVGETIRDLTTLAGESRGWIPRRKLVFE